MELVNDIGKQLNARNPYAQKDFTDNSFLEKFWKTLWNYIDFL